LTVVFRSAYQLGEQWGVDFDVKNLLNAPLRYYEGEPFRPIQREVYDATYEADVQVAPRLCWR
jgi:hypothetical protein